MKINQIIFKIVILLIITNILITFRPLMVRSDGDLHIFFCDVGQGDGIFIKTPKGSQILMDAGYDTKMLNCLEDNSSFLDQTIELGIVTHPHADHLGGFVPIAKRYNLKTFVRNKIAYQTPEISELENVISTMKVKPTEIELWTGDVIKADQIKIDILWPSKNAWNRNNGNWEAYLKDLNDSSIVALLTFKNIQILLTGDVGMDILNSVVQSTEFRQKLKSTSYKILKYPHHGSRDGLAIKALELFKSHIAVISSGKGNMYSHPHKEALEALSSFNFEIIRTDTEGTIHFYSDGNKLTRIK